MIRFYSPDIDTSHLLPPDEARHCCKVLRHRPGDIIEVVDGRGHLFRCRITEVGKRDEVALEILEKEYRPNPWSGKLTVGIAPTKNADRMEWVVEKLTEIGVDRIILLECEHSERRTLKTERLERIMVSAMKQSLKTRLPELMVTTPFSDVVDRYGAPGNRFIAYCDDAVGKRELCRLIEPGKDTVILIGPEGDFSPVEVEKAISHGYTAVSLGDCRLRTETAALVAADTFHIVESINNAI